MVAPYVYNAKRKEFLKNPTGFGYMVNDIANAVSKNHDVYLFTHHFTKGFKDDYCALKHCIYDTVINVGFKDLLRGFLLAVSTKSSLKNRLRYIFYYLNNGLLKKYISDIKPDIIHIHGLTFQTKPFIEICDLLQVPFIITLHGINGLSDTIQLPKKEKEYEKKELLYLSKKEIPITVVSTGIKERLCDSYSINLESIKVILNGTNSCEYKRCLENKKFYNVVCIGSICKRKNQEQLLNAYLCLPIELREKIKLHFYGVDAENIDLNHLIYKNQCMDNVYYHGFIPREQMYDIWLNADLNVVASKDEGFGLSIIEGFMFGVPTLTFSDIDALKDVYNSNSILLVNERSDMELAKGLEKAYYKKWDSSIIREWGNQFSMRKIAVQYGDLYLKTINKK